MVSRCVSGPDGRTAYERRKERSVQRGLPPFAEQLLCRVPEPPKPPARVEERWLVGIFVGVRDNSDEVFILNERGLFTARSVKRLEAGWRSALRDLGIDWCGLTFALRRNASDCSRATRGSWARHPEARPHQYVRPCQARLQGGRCWMQCGPYRRSGKKSL